MKNGIPKHLTPLWITGVTKIAARAKTCRFNQSRETMRPSSRVRTGDWRLLARAGIPARAVFSQPAKGAAVVVGWRFKIPTNDRRQGRRLLGWSDDQNERVAGFKFL